MCKRTRTVPIDTLTIIDLVINGSFLVFIVGMGCYAAYRWVRSKSGGMDVELDGLTFRFRDENAAEQGSSVSVRETVSSRFEMVPHSDIEGLNLPPVALGDPYLDEHVSFGAVDPAQLIAVLTPEVRSHLHAVAGHHARWLAGRYELYVPLERYDGDDTARAIVGPHVQLIRAMTLALASALDASKLADALLVRFRDDPVEGVRREALYQLGHRFAGSPQLAAARAEVRERLSWQHRARVVPVLEGKDGEALALEVLGNDAISDADVVDLVGGLSSWLEVPGPVIAALQSRALRCSDVLLPTMLAAMASAGIRVDESCAVQLSRRDEPAVLLPVVTLLGRGEQDPSAGALGELAHHWDATVATGAINALNSRSDRFATARRTTLAADPGLEAPLRALVQGQQQAGRLSVEISGQLSTAEAEQSAEVAGE